MGPAIRCESAAANSIVELIDRLLRTAFSEEDVLAWLAATDRGGSKFTYRKTEDSDLKPTKKAQVLCFVYGGHVTEKSVVHEVLAAALIAVRDDLQKLKHADSGDPDVQGHVLALGVATAGSRVTLRIDGELIQACDGRRLLKTLPNPLSINEIRKLTGVLAAATPMPLPPPAGPQRVQRKVPKSDRITVAGQRIRVSPTHAGTIVTIVVDDHHLRVLDGLKELSLHARTNSKPVRNFNAHRPHRR